MKYKYDIISIGDPVIDSFLFVDDVDVVKNEHGLKAMINWGDKLPVQKFYKSVAGNATNNAVGSRRLGLKSAYSCVIANDAGGREILHKMKKEGVGTEYMMWDDRHGTNYHTVLVHEGERTIFVFHAHRKWKLPKFAPSKWVYLTSMPEGFRKIYPPLLRYLKKYDVRLAFNPGTFQLKAGVSANKSILKVTDVISVNVEEAQLWVGDDTRDPEELCKRLHKLGPKAVALTDGRRGAYSYSQEGFYYIPEYPGERFEATGAGDAFTTAYVAALISGKTHKEALRWGPINAGNVVKHVGPIEGLLNRRELLKKMKSMPSYKPIEISDLKVKDSILKMVAKKKD